MLTVLLIVIVLALVLLGLAQVFGLANVKLTVLRLVRTTRVIRRRVIEPAMLRMSHRIRTAWIRPSRRRVADQLQRLADRVGRVAARSNELARARSDLTRAVNRLQDLSVAKVDPEATQPKQQVQKQGGSRDWLIAALLTVTGIAFAAGNVWLLTELVMPYLPDDLVTERTMTLPVAASSLAFLLGLAYYALRSFEGLGGRVFRAGAWLLIAMVAAGEGLAVVGALQASGMAAPTWWGGTAVAVLLGLSGALVPTVIAALAVAAIETLEHWLSTRSVREARRALRDQVQTSERLTVALGKLETRLKAVREEIVGLAEEDAGRLLLGADAATVERAIVVLGRLSRMVESDPDAPGEPTPGTIVTGGLLVWDLAVVVVWLLAAAAVLNLAVPAIAGLQSGGSGLIPFTLMIGVAVLLVMGAILRWIITEIPLERATAMRGALVILTGLAAAAVGVALGPAVSAGSALGVGPSQAGAWLVLLILVSAAASAGFMNGVRAAGALVTTIFPAIAWVVLAAANGVLAVFEVLLTGYRNRAKRRRRRGRPGND